MIVESDSLEELKNLNSESIDLLLTDPPYGISFMGKDWDKALPDKKIWAECLRVLKPGAFAFVMSIPRADCLSRMIISLEDAGFRTNFTPIYWAYASGFPKAQNIGKAVDKRKGTHPDKSREFASYIKAKRLELDIGLTEADEYVCGRTTNYSWFEGRPAGQRLPRLAEYERIKELLGLDNRFDEFMGEAEREVTGIYIAPDGKGRGGIANRPMDIGNYQWGDRSPHLITVPETPQAKALDGSYGGFQPKPAVEVIIVCMKPLSEKTFVDQALKNQKGITWLDDCRVPYDGERNLTEERYRYDINNDVERKFNPIGKLEAQEMHTTGRFPANLIVSDDVLNDGRILKTGGKYCKTDCGNSIFGKRQIDKEMNTDSGGSFSRYFDLDKWAQKTFPFLIVPKASKSEKNKGLDSYHDYQYRECGYSANISDSKLPRANPHPTVKPLKLMSYLITLGSREGDTVLDPFIGSGTTAVACKMLKRNCIGIDISKEYCEIANKRVEAVAVCLL